jgi:hypothetical protein
MNAQLQYISARQQRLWGKPLNNPADSSTHRRSVPEIYGRIAVYLQYRAFGKDCSRQSYCISSARGGQQHIESSHTEQLLKLC